MAKSTLKQSKKNMEALGEELKLKREALTLETEVCLTISLIYIHCFYLLVCSYFHHIFNLIYTIMLLFFTFTYKTVSRL